MSIEAGLKLSAAILTLAFGSIVLAGGPRRIANVALASFLFLLSANQGAEFLRALTDDPAWKVRWARPAAAFAALDPLALYYFASVFPERNSLNSPGKVSIVVAGSAVLSVGAFLPGAGQHLDPAWFR